jgi:hypothetical protein
MGTLAAGNLVAAEAAAYDLPFHPLAEARALVELYAEKGDRIADSISRIERDRRRLSQALSLRTIERNVLLLIGGFGGEKDGACL